MVRKIAAGEVVERPASVVKELLENAVDAGARQVGLTIEDGGKRLIRVTDDGCGMSPEELRLAVTQHATSKIADQDDLFAITTLGFRGEALASISSVSKVRIVSRRPDAAEGHEIHVVADEVEVSQAAGCRVGTTVEVRDLFFNVPARRKFLRTSSTEVGQINDHLVRVALGHPEVAFKLTNNGRVTQDLPVCTSRLARISKFYGPELASALLKTQREERGVELEVYAAPPAQSRATTQWQYTLVNGRYIRDRHIQWAIKEAYRGLTEPNRHGVVFLFLTVDPRTVDVNVHPTKIEVRWNDPSLIRSQVLSALREMFQRCDLTPPLRTDRTRAPVSDAEQDRIRREMADQLKATAPIAFGPSDAVAQAAAAQPAASDRWSAQGDFARSDDPLSTWRALYRAPEPSPSNTGSGSEWSGGGASAGSPAQVTADTPGAPQTVAARPPRAIQMHNLYLVAETDDGIVIVDQHALHERVLYEQFRQRITEGPLESQRLLLPETLTVTAGQLALLEEHAELLRRLGIELTPFGPDAIAIQSSPVLLKDTDVRGFMRDLLDHLDQGTGEMETDVVLDGVLSMMACKAAVKAGDPLTPAEIEALFQRRDLIDKPSSCPHGRPTTLRLTKADLNRQFHRT